MNYKNPVIRGFYPDPSMCRAGDRYYMVTSTFQYFPAVALLESTDMLNWHQIGSVLTRRNQVDLRDTCTRSGIFAPTIRYDHGRFYMIVTNVSHGGNFYVYTDNIYGEWSDPIFVKQDGIDPQLFFEDGHAYMISNGYDKDHRDCIQISEIDIETGEQLSPSEPLWYGTGGPYTEGPHLYHIGDYYYVSDSEGGTEYGHMINYARSKSMMGPYEPFPGNPALTNRNLKGYTLAGAGHGDLIEDKNGDWWLCHLAFRQIPGAFHFHHLGRETCMLPVTWKDGWFYINDGASYIDMETDREVVQEERSYDKCFENLSPERDYLFIHRWEKKNYRFLKNALVMIGKKDSPFEQPDDPSFAGIRLSEFHEDLTVTVEGAAAEAGCSLYMDTDHHYDLFIEEGKTAVLRFQIGCATEVKRTVPVSGPVKLMINGDGDNYAFSLECGGKKVPLDVGMARYLSSEVEAGFTGALFGMYVIDRDGRKARFTDLHIRYEEMDYGDKPFV